jgi:hypothetical protein
MDEGGGDQATFRIEGLRADARIVGRFEMHAGNKLLAFPIVVVWL